jgi:hypothetical protein
MVPSKIGKFTFGKKNHAWCRIVESKVENDLTLWQTFYKTADLFHQKMNKVQQKAWRKFCDTLDYQSDARQVTKVIDSLTDTESIQSANVLLHPVTNTIKMTPSARANAHSIYFASVSHKPYIESSEQPAFNAMKQQVHDYLHRPDDSPNVKPFSMKELKSALKKLNDKHAPGDDNISAEALHCLH